TVSTVTPASASARIPAPTSAYILPPASVPAPTSVPTPAPVPAKAPVSSDPITELTKQFAQLSLLIQSSLGNLHSTTAQSSGNPSAPPLVPPPARTFRCIWCDSTEHGRRECLELAAAIPTKLIRFNDQGRIVNAAGEELQVRYGRGGMRSLLENAVIPITVTTRHITVGPPITTLGERSTFQTTIDFDTGTRTDEIIDVDVDAKRGRDESRPFVI